MQIIYIDTLVCVNLFIDYFILCTTKKILHINTSSLRLISASIVGAVSCVSVLLPFYNTFVSIIYKALISFAVTTIGFRFARIKQMLLRTSVFLSISISLCGVVVLINKIFIPNRIIIYNDTLYFDISPALLICSTLICHLGFLIYEKIFKRHNLNCRINTVTIITPDNNTYIFESAVDTGCHLYEPFSGAPVILTEKELLSEMVIPKEKSRVIFFETASGSGSIKGFKPEKIYINNELVQRECYIGLCENKLSGEVKSIMGTELLEVI